MNGRFHQSDSFSIANLLSMQPKHNPHRIVHPDPLLHLRKLTPDGTAVTTAESNALLALHHQHYHPNVSTPYFCNNPAIPSTSGHPAISNSSEGFTVKMEEAMMMSTDHRHHQNGGASAASGESSLPNEPTSIDSADSGK